MICEKCGHEMIYNLAGNSCSWSCPQCGWGLATSYFAPIEMDQTEYSILVQNVASPSVSMIKCVARILACNSMTARTLLQNGSCTVSGKATLIKNYISALDSAGLQYHIEPRFPY